MDSHGCEKIVFSSSATVYGTPQYLQLDEDHPVSPVNPYGQTKLMVENVLKDWVQDWRSATALRYFNPVGAHVFSRIGEDPHDIPNNLMPFIAQVAIGKREALQIFGDDYETRDGTGERDYIHVTDLAGAYCSFAVVEAAGFAVYNVGTGQGTTVKELWPPMAKLLAENYPSRPFNAAPAMQAPLAESQWALNWSATSVYDAVVLLNWRSQNPDGYVS